MPDSTRPFLVLYVVWHPGYKRGAKIAEVLRRHFRRELYENVAGGTGLSVVYRSTAVPGSRVPLPIALDEAETTAVVILAESKFAEDPDWVGYVRELVECTEAKGLASRVFPVSIDPESVTALGLKEQALRWDRWTGTAIEQQRQLIFELCYGFCRMLRHYLEHLERPQEDAALEAYLKNVQVFLSHSKHDKDGERIANAIRDWLHQSGHGLLSFFDVKDIPAGVPFDKVLLNRVKVSAMMAIHTDSYSSREWCRREVIEAKRWNVPLVVANCIRNLDDRAFPYLGNVPMVRLDPYRTKQIEFVVGRLLDEVLKDFLWRCRVKLARAAAGPAMMFLPRPPELISLAGLPKPADTSESVLVYPDPPLSAEEERLFEAVAPWVRLRSLTEWLAGGR